MTRISFATFDPLTCDVSPRCDLCSSSRPVFTYEFRTQDEFGERRFLYGFCCSSCGPKLLKKLERKESREWMAEEAALQADELDVSDSCLRLLVPFRGKRS
jgi:hypothetical protein